MHVRVRVAAHLVGVVAVFTACRGGVEVAHPDDVPSLESSVTRRPPSVALAPAAQVPDATGAADADGIVALRDPVHAAAADRAVRRFFDLAVGEESDGLRSLFSREAVLLPPLKNGTPVSFWQARHRALEYSHLAGLELVPEKGVRRFRYADLAPGKSRARPGEMQEGDLLVVVPVTTPRLGTDRFFGDVVLLLLRREGSDVKIVGYGEEN